MMGMSSLRFLGRTLVVAVLLPTHPHSAMAEANFQGIQAEASQGQVPEASSLPVDGEGLFDLGNRLYQEGRFDGALEAYQAVLEGGFESADLYYNLANAHFKTGDLGRSILNYERALRSRPRDPDIRANLELARSLTADEVEPLPRFWVLSAISWWVNLFPRGWLVVLVGFSYLLGATGLCVVLLSRRPPRRRLGAWVAGGGALGLLLLGATFLARAGILGGTEWGVILTEAVPVQSAPSDDDDLTLFHVHEGTRVRIDQNTDTWLEIVLEDGKVGWVPSGVLEII